jgi:putative resolvase
MERIVAIGEAADVLGVSIATLRRWEAVGKLALKPTAGGRRRDDVAKLRPELIGDADAAKRKTVAYARMSRRMIKRTICNGKNRFWNSIVRDKA